MLLRLSLALAIPALVIACARPLTEPAPAVETGAVETVAVAHGEEATMDGCGGGCSAHDDMGGCGSHAGGHELAHAAATPYAFEGAPAPGTKAMCVVMNREFVVEAATATSVFEGKTYPFCCEGCKEQFDADPAKFAALASSRQAAAGL